MRAYYVVRSSHPAGVVSSGLLDGLLVRLRRPYAREGPAGFGLERLTTAFMNNPGWRRLNPLATDRSHLAQGCIMRRGTGYVHLWFGVATPPRPAISDRTGPTVMAAPAG